MAKKLLTQNILEPLNGATTAKVAINMVDGNLTVDKLTGGEPVLASGTLQYLENQGRPTQSANMKNGQTTLTLQAGGKGQPWFRFPWAACNGATDWLIHLNPSVPSDIVAHTGGGNVRLDLAGMVVTRVLADTGGGNMEIVLPESTADLSVTATSGAGNVMVCLPGSAVARISATSGLGIAIVDPRFQKIDDHTYQSPDYDSATNKVEIKVKSGAGNVSVSTK